MKGLYLKGSTRRKEYSGMEKKYFLTYSDLVELKKELEHLKTTRRTEVAKKIKDARKFGDLSENKEYAAAKDEQWEIENRIQELEKLLQSVDIVEECKDQFTINEGILLKYDGPGINVVIPEGVTEIANEAFRDCSDLTSVTIPESVTEIAEISPDIFEYCTSLTSEPSWRYSLKTGEPLF